VTEKKTVQSEKHESGQKIRKGSPRYTGRIKKNYTALLTENWRWGEGGTDTAAVKKTLCYWENTGAWRAGTTSAPGESSLLDATPPGHCAGRRKQNPTKPGLEKSQAIKKNTLLKNTPEEVSAIAIKKGSTNILKEKF